ncbi:MAG: hypothetical protein QOH05_2391 [Acetobacteraceae bacterium]|nr:hypothetical protein [Acetobacteraceae bacterium]
MFEIGPPRALIPLPRRTIAEPKRRNLATPLSIERGYRRRNRQPPGKSAVVALAEIQNSWTMASRHNSLGGREPSNRVIWQVPAVSANRSFARTESRASWRLRRHKRRPSAIREFLNSTQGLVVNASSAHRGHSSACTCGHCHTGTARYGQSSVLLGAEVRAVKRLRPTADAARSSGKSW